MTTAFGKAMLGSINGQPQRFSMTMVGGRTSEMNCHEFLNTRKEEEGLLNEINIPKDGRVLDFGCGIGRHLTWVRNRYPAVHCSGIEICDSMLEYSRQKITAPATFVQTFGDLKGQKFDLILLMGNGLGVLGCEANAVAALEALVKSLRRNGRIVIETGNPFGTGYFSAQFTIDYQQHHDGPFTWGYSDREWITRTLRELGCTVEIQPSHAPGGMFFFAIGEKGEDGPAK